MSVAAVFSALGDPTRMTIVQKLVEGGPTSLSRLADGLPVTRQAIAKHLLVLGKAGVVATSRKGREQIVKLEPEALSEASVWLSQRAREWDDRLGRLRRLLES
jgi:DNA-binding transcriptional ArsR family regulator